MKSNRFNRSPSVRREPYDRLSRRLDELSARNGYDTERIQRVREILFGQVPPSKSPNGAILPERPALSATPS